MPAAFRIIKTKYVENAFDGEGARLFGGRWNSRGTPMIYTAESVSLAALEMLVHLENADLFASYSIIKIEFHENLTEKLDISNLPRNWKNSPAPKKLLQIGDEWIRSQTSAILQVPSAIIEKEFNFLINPLHSDFGQIKINLPEPFSFDKRLMKS
ncbi:MAG TPA: RES family NAD+ phosphorylase [Pyrinomonadaceae bacterium]|nr:RES family NAD+ phosphorylase [Pyrinomonadaceae bacterium]